MKDKQVTCQDCGFRYDGAQKLCPMCGSKHRRTEPENSVPQQGRKKNPKVVGGIVIITAMILMSFGASVLLREMNEPVKEPAPAPEPGISASESATPPVDGAAESVVPVQPEAPAFNEEQLRRDCQAVVDSYSAQMRAATPRLMEEFKAETEGESDGRVLAHVCNEKIGELAGLCNDGMRELWDLLYVYHIDPAHPDYEDYTEYEFRLNLVYEDGAEEISSLYSEYYILHAS